jgi:ElaB/YqjD/DUF883 family membrane-anchored ribosome-binding protein
LISLKQIEKKDYKMSKHTSANTPHPTHLAEDARALVAATAHVAEEKVIEARNRMAATLESAREIVGQVRYKAVKNARATDKAIREHPYRAVGIGFGIGALIGYFLARRRSSNDN